jgi:hypothetical protein
VPTTAFKPSSHGFRFRNHFDSKPVMVPGFGDVPTRGRGGGMAYAALDYWCAGLPVPTHTAEDFVGGGVPEDGSRLSDYLYKRQSDSFATWTARQFVTWALAADQPTWADPGVIARTADEQLPRLRRSIDAGRPVVLGLVAASALDDLASNHQVVAYGYEAGNGNGDGEGTVRVRVYDPDRLDEEVVLTIDASGRRLESSVDGQRWRGCFVQDYIPERPPYQDLAVSRGIWVNSWTPTLGRHFVAQYAVRNYGDHPARLAELCVAVRGPSGERLDNLLGGDGDSTPLDPGSERALFKAVVNFGTRPGNYELAAAYRCERGTLVALPPAEPGTISQLGVTAIAPERDTRVVVRFTHLTVEDAAVVGGRLSLGLAVNGRSVQWPPDGVVEVEDGKTFDVEECFELMLKPNQPLSVTVAGAGSDGESGGVICERWLGLDDWGRGDHTYRSRMPMPVTGGPAGVEWAEGAYTINFLIETANPEPDAPPQPREPEQHEGPREPEQRTDGKEAGEQQ